MIDFKQNREALLARMEANSIALIPSATQKSRNNDNEYPFRQDSSFYWLSGFNESDAMIVLLKSDDSAEHLLFCKVKNKAQEIWTGKLAGQQGAVNDFGFDRGLVIDELDKLIPELLLGRAKIYAPDADEGLHSKITQWKQAAQLLNMRARRRDFARGAIQTIPSQAEDITPILECLRMVKTDAEIERIQTACDISAQAHKKLMRKARPGKTEGYLQGIFDGYCRKHQAESLAYPSIVGSGQNATCLHYEKNDSILANGDLVLIDAGCEYKSYASDITRTFPINGKFSEPQRQLYDVVLAAQLAGIAACKPGNTYYDCEKAAQLEMIRGLIELGILEGDVDTLFANDVLKQFYPHSVGHWVGLDVHDANPRSTVDGWIPYLPNMVVTVEPGLYIQPDHNETDLDNPNHVQVDPKWLGIGIRIEDVVQITPEGCRVLSDKVPKQAETIEAMMAVAHLERERKLMPSLDRHRAVNSSETTVMNDGDSLKREDKHIAKI